MGPLLIIFIIGMAFNNQSLQNINIGLYVNSGLNETNTSIEITNPSILKIHDSLNESFSVSYVTSLDACIKGVKIGAHHACIELPLGLDPEEVDADNYVHIYSDLSQINLAYSLLAEVSESVSLETKRLSLLFTENLIEEIRNSESTITTGNEQLSDVKTDLNSLGSDLDQARDRLGTMSLDAGSGFEDLEDLPSTADSIDSRVTDLQSLAEVIEDDYDDLVRDIDNKQDDYDVDCENSTSDDCDELMVEIDTLSDTKNLFENYLTYTGNSSDSLEDLLDEIRTIAYAASASYNQLNTNLAHALTIRNSAISAIDDSTLSIDLLVSDVTSVSSDFSDLLSGYSEIKLKDSEKIVNPLNVSVHTVAKEGTFLDYSFPLLIILVISFLGILLSSNVIMIEKKSSAFFRNYITPVREFMFLISVYFVMMIIMIIDVIIVMLAATIFFNFSISLASLPSLLPAILIIATVFVLIGMSIGFIFKDEEGATITSIFLSTILFLFSPIVIPLENMSIILSKIASFSPLVLGMEVLKRILIFDVSILESGWAVLFLFVYIALLVFAIFSTHEFHKKRI